MAAPEEMKTEQRAPTPPVHKPETVKETEDDEKTTESSTGGDPVPEDKLETVVEQPKEIIVDAPEDETEQADSKEKEKPWNSCGCGPEMVQNMRAAVGLA